MVLIMHTIINILYMPVLGIIVYRSRDLTEVEPKNSIEMASE